MRPRNYKKFTAQSNEIFKGFNLAIKRRKTKTQWIIRGLLTLAVLIFSSGFILEFSSLTGLNSRGAVVSAHEAPKKFNPVKSGYVIKTQSPELNGELRKLFCPENSEGNFCQDAMQDSEHMVGVVALLHRQHKLDRTVFLNVKKVKEGYVFSVLVFDKANYVVVDQVDLVPDLEFLHGYVMGIGGKSE